MFCFAEVFTPLSTGDCVAFSTTRSHLAARTLYTCDCSVFNFPQDVADEGRRSRGSGVESGTVARPLIQVLSHSCGWRQLSRLSQYYIGVLNTTPLDWIVQCFTSPPTQYRLYGRRFLQVKRPNQQYQNTEGESCKGKQHKEQRKHKIHMHRHTQK